MVLTPGKIYCIGDSHTLFFLGENSVTTAFRHSLIPFFEVHHLGPVLAYNLLAVGTTVKGREQLFTLLERLPKGAKVLLSFGEIDCRCHVFKQISKTGMSLNAAIEEVTSRYFQVISEVADLGFRVCVWGPPPSSRDEGVVHAHLYPATGTQKERNQAIALFGKILQKKLSTISVQYISLFDKFVDGDGARVTECHFDGIHLSQKVMPLAIQAMRQDKILSRWNEILYCYLVHPAIIYLYLPARSLRRIVLKLKNKFHKRLPVSLRVFWDYHLKPSLRNSWGGGFNGQQARQKIFLALVKECHFSAIVETGSFRGTTTEFILNNSTAPVFSVEHNREFHLYSKIRLARYKNCFLSQGDSRSFIKQLTEDKTFPRKNLFFYLDAHWSADLPLEEEFAMICRSFSNWVVMIDDFKVPGDDGYGYDDYGPGKTLELEYLSHLIKQYRLNVYFPSAASSLETSVKRGCIVLTSEELILSEMGHAGHLRAL